MPRSVHDSKPRSVGLALTRFEPEIDKTVVLLLTIESNPLGVDGPSVLESLKRTPKYKMKCHDELNLVKRAHAPHINQSRQPPHGKL